MVTSIVTNLQRRFGIIFSPSLSARQNAFNVFASMPFWLYIARPSNTAVHDLTPPNVLIPSGIRALLGLGLNFCPQPTSSSSARLVDTNRFSRDIFTKSFFRGTKSTVPKLFVRSNWQPNPKELSPLLITRTTRFINLIEANFRRRRSRSNLLSFQAAALRFLQSDTSLQVLPTDKNLGPAVLERTTYIRRALSEHLLCPSQYKSLSESEAYAHLETVKMKLNRFITKTIRRGHPDATFLRRHRDMVKDPFSHFYIIAKVHKNPWKTRPIVSYCGSLLYGLGKWLDHQLQKVVATIQYTVSSSWQMKNDLLELPPLSPRARLFSADAQAMYPSINTQQAISFISAYLSYTEFPPELDLNIPAIEEALDLVMRNNLFKFGDTYWLQLNGTAMGAPPAPMYATLYFYICELGLIPDFPQIKFYRRYIDDAFGIWEPDTDRLADDEFHWKMFQSRFNATSSLIWDFTPRVRSLDFLDITVSILPSGRIHTKLFAKAMNLYLYLPSHTCHAPSVLRSFICSMIQRIYRLCSDPADRISALKLFYCRLLARGYKVSNITRLFSTMLHRLDNNQAPAVPPATTTSVTKLYVHLPYHPLDPPAKQLQDYFSQTFNPSRERPLDQIPNRRNVHFGPNSLTVAYHRQKTLGNILFPRRFRSHGAPVSTFLRDESTPSP